MIRKSFKVSALVSAIDASDDKDIHCFKEQEPCHADLKLNNNFNTSKDSSLYIIKKKYSKASPPPPPPKKNNF